MVLAHQRLQALWPQLHDAVLKLVADYERLEADNQRLNALWDVDYKTLTDAVMTLEADNKRLRVERDALKAIASWQIFSNASSCVEAAQMAREEAEHCGPKGKETFTKLADAIETVAHLFAEEEVPDGQ